MAQYEKRPLAMIAEVIRSRLSLTEDKADDHVIDEELRASVEMRGTNLWILMFAIFIASIGLNVNSTAVVIGAMLISPLMGPIIGIGYGVGILDFVLIRRALKNLAIAASIGLVTSTAYFLVSPLTTADTELLARTTPTIWDVLIAFFGGFAGIIGLTRKDKSNVVPGVAIATALMPPLCTAGFGIAHGNWADFGGALFLFTINCVFIAFSAAIIVRAFHVQHKKFIDEAVARRVRRYVAVVVAATVVPSAYLAYQLVQDEIFKAKAKAFVSQELQLIKSHVTETRISPDSRMIEVTLVGEYVPPEKISELAARLPSRGLERTQLQVHQAGDSRIDVTSLKASLLGDLYKQSQLSLEEKDKVIAQLRSSLDAVTQNWDRYKEIPAELHALYPEIDNILVSDAIDWSAGSAAEIRYAVVLNVRTNKLMRDIDKLKIEEWLRTRTHAPIVKVFVETAGGSLRKAR